MNDDPKPVGWNFWFLWVVAGGAAGLLSLAGSAYLSIIGFIVTLKLFGPALSIGNGIVFGAMFGGFQWLVLRRALDGAGWWIAASLIGGTISGATRLVASVPEAWSPVVFGTSVGIAQWIVLSRRVSRSGWWIPSSILSWTVAGSVFFAIIGFSDSGVVLLGSVFIAGLLCGTLSGGPLVWLLSRTARSTGELL